MTDSELRNYLLERPAVAEAIEAQLLDDQELYDRLRLAEDELFDEYANGRLTAAERELFIQRYGHERSRMAFAIALARKAQSVRTVPRFRQWMPLAAAAVLTIAVGTTLLRRGDSASIATPSAPSKQAPAPAVGGAPAVADPEIRLTLSTARSEGSANTLTLPAGVGGFVVRVRLDPADAFDAYEMEIRSAADAVVWRRHDLRRTAENGNYSIAATIPASAVADGEYEVAVRGRTEGGVAEPLGFVSMRIVKGR